MVGHGSPRASRAWIARLARAAPGLCWAALVWLIWLSAAPATAEEATLQLRIAWGGGTERIWQGSIRLQGGQLADAQTLGIEADEAGSIWVDGDAIEIRQRSVRPTTAWTCASPPISNRSS